MSELRSNRITDIAGTASPIIPGAVINFKKVTTNTNVVFPTNSTFTTFLSLDYTPLLVNSTLLVEVSCSSVSKTTGGGGWIGIRLDLDDVDSGTMGGAFMYPTASNDTRQPFYSKAVIDSWGTSSKTVVLAPYVLNATVFEDVPQESMTAFE
jgi:hypothetical protein